MKSVIFLPVQCLFVFKDSHGLRCTGINTQKGLIVANNMSRNRYFQLRSHLKVVDDNTVSEKARSFLETQTRVGY